MHAAIAAPRRIYSVLQAMIYRVYFNRWAEAPLIWSVDCGSQESERTVREVILKGVSGRTRSGAGDNVQSPTVWLEVDGQMEITGDVATIRGPA